ncbi:hypothetical protein NRP93_001507 [Clostridium botulinum]|nr:hypothetical protein [Clostridium botulinum]
MKETIKYKRSEEFLYDFLISVAPTKKEKNIIASIRQEEIKNSKTFIKLYTLYTGQSIYLQPNTNFQKPKSYIDGIKKAKLYKLNSIEKYTNIRSSLPNEYHKNILSNILTNELKHNDKYNYILNVNLKKYRSTVRNYYRQPKEFTLDELSEYDGTMGKPAYVAVNRIVYDVTDISKWSGGTHFGLTAGKDLTSQFESCHGSSSKLKKLPKVGILK